jgi:hypothetical protein
MKSLVRSAKTRTGTDKAAKNGRTTPTDQTELAQCCAKVSKTVAGCHD